MDFTVTNLGECEIPSPLIDKFPNHGETVFVYDSQRMRFHVKIFFDEQGEYLNEDLNEDNTFELAGPRRNIYFAPGKIRSAIVTCGGLCPGLNDVIRSIVMESWYRYGSKDIIGIQFGYNGLNPTLGYDPLILTPDKVNDIHKDGGTILGSSRGGTDDMEMLVNTLAHWGVNILYTIGGDGTLKGTRDIVEIARKRGMDLAVIGIPKTIDNDISFIQRSFGFETAYSKAVDAILTAHAEAKGAPHGIGLVKLMGRHSGFIAANTALAMNDVNFVLIPEIPFDLEGPNGLLRHIEDRLRDRGHAVLCVAEGAGQNLMVKDPENQGCDASGNVKLEDIGLYLKAKINNHFKDKKFDVNLKYIDPSYIIRSAPAVPSDSIFCALLGQYAVHAGMAGKTDIIIGQWNNIYTHVPIKVAVSRRKEIMPDSRFWYNVIEATGQPMSMLND